MRRREALLLLGVVACGGQVGTRSTSDGGSFLDASTDTGVVVEQDSGTIDSSVPVDSGAEAVAPFDAAPLDAGCDAQGDASCCPATAPVGPCSTNGEACQYPGNACTCSSGCTAGECCPASCPQLGFPCGQVGDGCGSILNCRTCPAGQTCNAGICGGGTDAGCVVGTCPASACGLIDDGCGGKIQCGGCYWSCVLSGP
jgi:hypothetical protein